MCGHRRTRSTLADRPAEAAADGSLRVSDAQREDTVEVLRASAGAGRLDVDELADRVGQAYAARTVAQLAALTRDLPAVRPPTPGYARRPARRPGGSLAVFVAVNLVFIAIWALTGAGYPWFIWPLLGWGASFVLHGGPPSARLRAGAPARHRLTT